MKLFLCYFYFLIIYYFFYERQNIIPSSINLRSKGTSQSSGKLHKGCVKDATTKLSIGSIPSTYQSIIYKTDNKRAFGTSEKRFFDKENAQITRESNYQDNSTVESYQSETKVNHNKLGQNSFISKQKRDWLKCTQTPGPTHYYEELKKRKCFTRQSDKKIRLIKTSKRKQEKTEEIVSPGPGEYIFDKKQFLKTSNKGWKSSFETKINRDGYIPEKLSPGPGYYQLIDKPDKNVRQNSPEKSGEKSKQTNILRQILRENKRPQPGPCSYNQQIPSFKPLYERIKMSSNFMAPLNPGKKKNRGTPSPTAYEVKRIFENMQPKLIESTFIMSETKRDPFTNKECINVGPLDPQPLGHKNFHFNIKNEWIC